eukprot:6194332-Pleurochrysis_carterae.AAC.4
MSNLSFLKVHSLHSAFIEEWHHLRRADQRAMETSNSKAGAGEGAGAVRWGVLFAFAFSAASNSFMFMDFSTTAALSEHVLECDSYSLEWLYSASLLTVMPLSLPAAFLLVRYNWATSFAGKHAIACAGLPRLSSEIP